MVLYSVNYGGESASNPKTRLSSYRPAHYRKMVKGSLQAFSSDELHDGLVVCVVDGGKSGLEREFTNVFVHETSDGANKTAINRWRRSGKSLGCSFPRTLLPAARIA